MDIEVLEDANFGVKTKTTPKINYEDIIDKWIEQCEELNIKSTCFVLGSFAKKYPKSIEKLVEDGHEVASHGLTHDLIYKQTFDTFKHSISESKKILEDITQCEVKGYRSASWSLPFERKYYEILAQNGYTYSSSYFPFKTYMYGNSIDKKEPFEIITDAGIIKEIPLLKSYLPFSGGFYLRVLPLFLHKILIKSLISKNYKPIIYTHPYEMSGKYLLRSMSKEISFDMAYILAFAETSPTRSKLKKLLTSLL
jgi:polysaccharide deacetylase family protein (PEP-CTERM system associated)